MSKRLVIAVLVLVAIGLGMAVLGYKLGDWTASSKHTADLADQLAATPVAPPTDTGLVEEESDELPSDLSLRRADYYGLSTAEFHRLRLATAGLGATPAGEGPHPYPELRVAWTRWRKDFQGKALAEAAREVYALLLKQRILTTARPIVEVEAFPIPLCERGACLDDGPFRWRVIVPIMPDVASTRPPLQVESLGARSIAVFEDMTIGEEALEKLANTLPRHVPRSNNYHLLFRMKDNKTFNWGGTEDPPADVILPIP